MQIEIDGHSVRDAGAACPTILDVAKRAGVWIPTLCLVHGKPARGTCRLCMVSVEGRRGLVSACSTSAMDGMVVTTNSDEIRAVQRSTMRLILAEHGACNDSGCELHRLARRLGCCDTPFSAAARAVTPTLLGSDYIAVNAKRCVMCERCVQVCEHGVISRVGRGTRSSIAFDGGNSLASSRCVGCGDCAAVCPSGAMSVRRDEVEIISAWFLSLIRNRLEADGPVTGAFSRWLRCAVLMGLTPSATTRLANEKNHSETGNPIQSDSV